MSYSVGIIKPERMKKSSRKKIREMIEKNGLRIVASAVIIFTEEIINCLYDNVAPEVREANARLLAGREAELLIIEGKYAVRRLFNLAGKETDPSKCEKHTIRFRFGGKKPVLLSGGYKFYLNAFHRSKNVEERERELAIARRFITF